MKIFSELNNLNSNEKILKNLAHKVKEKIEEAEYKIKDGLIYDERDENGNIIYESQITKLIKKADKKCANGLNAKIILKKALEMIAKENDGIFPSDILKDKYLDLVFEDIKKATNEGEELHEVIKRVLKELKGKGINLDREVGQKAKSLSTV